MKIVYRMLQYFIRMSILYNVRYEYYTVNMYNCKIGFCN